LNNKSLPPGLEIFFNDLDCPKTVYLPLNIPHGWW